MWQNVKRGISLLILGSAMKLRTLKPAIPMVGSRIAMLDRRPGATERTRGSAWMKTRERWLRAHPLCCQCEAEGRTTLAEEVDHITPLWKGGPDTSENLQSLCREHHNRKTAEEAAERARGF